MKPLIFACFAVVLFSCANQQINNTIVLDYEDFGPQVLSHEIVGMQWWQWQSREDSKLAFYDIKVVVYRNIPIEAVKSLYSVKEKKLKDYRYLSYENAMQYLDESISENVLPVVTERLKNTKAKIVTHLAH